jgi:hypothetical protein
MDRVSRSRSELSSKFRLSLRQLGGCDAQLAVSLLKRLWKHRHASEYARIQTLIICSSSPSGYDQEPKYILFREPVDRRDLSK